MQQDRGTPGVDRTAAASATVLLNLEGAPDRVAFWPAMVVDDLSMSAVEMPLVDAGERLGNITVAMAAGHPVAPSRARLLADLANQAGMAFRHARAHRRAPRRGGTD